MKKKCTLISLVLAFAMVLGGIQTVFAGYTGFETVPQLEGKGEDAAEAVAMQLYKETKAGGYDLIDTAELSSKMDANESFLLIDTMPAGSYDLRHLQGAVNVCSPMTSDMEDPKAEGYEAKLLNAAKTFSGTKKVTYFWNAKTKKWVTKKPAAKYYKKCTKKGKHYGKKYYSVNKAIKNKPIIVYCGYVKCDRSHVAAEYLVKQGYTKVYRYPGGISAWYDVFKGEKMDGSNPQQGAVDPYKTEESPA